MAKADVIPFGKYKGQPVEVLKQDPDYCEWLLAQDWVRQRFAPLCTVIVNHFGAPEETPEHNALQSLFAEDAFAKRFYLHWRGDAVVWKCFDSEKKRRLAEIADHRASLAKELKRIQSCNGHPPAAPYDEASFHRYLAQVDLKTDLTTKVVVADALAVETTFETHGIDVLLVVRLQFPAEVSGYMSDRPYSHPWLDQTVLLNRIFVECKPSLADEYPAVLRQITSFNSAHNVARVVFVGDGGYRGTGAALDVVRKVFASQNVQIILRSELGA